MFKKIIALILAALIIYSIYYDMTTGTLPTIQAAPASAFMPLTTGQTDDPIQFIAKTAKAGDTVISIVERLQQGPLPVSIDQVIEDFQHLNEGVTPNQIQIGKEYKFPLYNE